MSLPSFCNRDSSCCLLSTYYVPGTVLGTSHTWYHLILAAFGRVSDIILPPHPPFLIISRGNGDFEKVSDLSRITACGRQGWSVGFQAHALYLSDAQDK